MDRHWSLSDPMPGLSVKGPPASLQLESGRIIVPSYHDSTAHYNDGDFSNGHVMFRLPLWQWMLSVMLSVMMVARRGILEGCSTQVSFQTNAKPSILGTTRCSSTQDPSAHTAFKLFRMLFSGAFESSFEDMMVEKRLASQLRLSSCANRWRAARAPLCGTQV